MKAQCEVVVASDDLIDATGHYLEWIERCDSNFAD